MLKIKKVYDAYYTNDARNAMYAFVAYQNGNEYKINITINDKFTWDSIHEIYGYDRIENNTQTNIKKTKLMADEKEDAIVDQDERSTSDSIFKLKIDILDIPEVAENITKKQKRILRKSTSHERCLALATSIVKKSI